MSQPREQIELGAAWEAVSARVQNELGWLQTRSWLPDVRLTSLEGAKACLEVESAESRAKAHEHAEFLKAALSEAAGRKVRLRFALAKKRGTRRGRKGRKGREEGPEIVLQGERPNPANTLSSFMVGPANEIAVRFAQEAVERPGAWHPLVFYGESGNGKTHIIQGIVNATRRRRPAARVVFVSGDRFARHYVLAMHRRQTERFRAFYRERVDLLVIDNLQELVGKPGTERELNFTLDQLQMSGGQVVISSAVHPKKLGHANPGLEARLLGGQLVHLAGADTGTRTQIIRARCAKGGLPLEAGVAEFLSEGVDLNARELVTALTRLGAHHRLVGTVLDVEAVRLILADVIERKLRPASLEGVAAFVAERLGVSVDQLRGRSRKPTVVRVRQLAMALCRDLTQLTLREVGCYFGKRSCACVHSAQQRAQELCTEDAHMRTVWGDAGRRFVRPGGAREG